MAGSCSFVGVEILQALLVGLAVSQVHGIAISHKAYTAMSAAETWCLARARSEIQRQAFQPEQRQY